MLPTMCIERSDALPWALGAHTDARGGKVRVRSRCEEPAQLTTVGADLQLCGIVRVDVEIRMVPAVRNQGVVTYVIATYLQNGRKNVARAYAVAYIFWYGRINQKLLPPVLSVNTTTKAFTVRMLYLTRCTSVSPESDGMIVAVR